MKSRRGPSIVILVALALLGIAWLDRATNELPVHHLYYLPIILAAGRFRKTGGLLAAGVRERSTTWPIHTRWAGNTPNAI